jgi:D-glycero-D-manno-heptose 1,7-bisphosphate phosphatase
MKPILLLDRDGVVNDQPKFPDRYVLSVEKLRIREGVIREIVRIQKFALVAFVSNQQCIGKKLVTLDEVKKINHEINLSLIACGGTHVEFFICPHLEEDRCECRKPKPGLLLQAINKFRYGDKQECIFVGDQQVDFEAATKAKIDFRFVYDEGSTIKTLRSIQMESFTKVK